MKTCDIVGGAVCREFMAFAAGSASDAIRHQKRIVFIVLLEVSDMVEPYSGAETLKFRMTLREAQERLLVATLTLFVG